MLITFFLTFAIIAALQSIWYFTITIGFAVDHLHTDLVGLVETTERKIDPAELMALVQEGKANEAGFSDDPRYVGILNWLDTIHQVYPSAWPYVFVPGANPDEIVYVVDLYARYDPAKAKKFLQPGSLVTGEDEALTKDIYLHVAPDGMLPQTQITPPTNFFNKIIAEVNHTLSAWGQWVSVYGYIRNDQGQKIAGVGVGNENLAIPMLGNRIIVLLIVSFFGSVIVMMLVGLRFGTFFTNSIVRLTRAAEKIGAGEHEAGLAQLQTMCKSRFSIDEVTRLAETFRKLVNFQYALYTISATANTTSDLNALYALTYVEVSDLIQADSFTIALYDEHTQKIKLLWGIDGSGSTREVNIREYPLVSPPDLIGYVIQTGRPLVISQQDISNLLESRSINQDTRPAAWLGVPLRTADQKTFGVLVAQSNAKNAHFSENDKSLLSFIAAQLTMAVKRSHAEAELRQSYQLLEQRVQDRTHDLQEANLNLQKEIGERLRIEAEMQKAKEAAVAANIAKSVFLANMSHELRTPLNAILGFSRLMSHDPNLPVHQKEDLGIILQSGEHLLELINDVLEMSKIEAGRVVLTPNNFDLHRLLQEIEEIFQTRAAEKGLALIYEADPDLPPYIQTDEKKLRQVFLNLLSNAVKFTERGGITVRSRLKEQLSTQEVLLGFEIEDTGPGIPLDQIRDLFNYFVQTEAGKKLQEGTGLGLSISRNFVRMMSGDINVTSQVGVGSIFAFEIRVGLAKREDVLARPRERRAIGIEPDQGQWRILVAEDREANRKLLVKLLKPFVDPLSGQGFEIREAVNGREAVEIWAAWAPHLIFMDMRMPEMDGHEATQRIRATIKGHATVIVALTASAFEEERKLILSEGINDFIRKPFKDHEIFDVLSKHLGIRFVYAEEPVLADVIEMAGPKSVLALNESPTLPTEWLGELTHAAAAADGERIHELLEQIRVQNPQLADSLQGLAAQYRFDLIIDALPKRV
jgi:signal transduction histidine kinase/CheY-like chemotaxis protein